MALENVCNEDMTVALSNNAGPPDIVYTGDVGITNAGVTTTQSTKCKALAKMVSTTSCILVWLQAAVPPKPCPHTSATHTFVGGGGVVTASATKTKAEGFVVLREGDNDTVALGGVGCIGGWLDGGGNPVPCACDISISSAGQSKAKAQ